MTSHMNTAKTYIKNFSMVNHIFAISFSRSILQNFANFLLKRKACNYIHTCAEFICTILKICYGSTPVCNHIAKALVEPTIWLKPWLTEPEIFHGWSNQNIFLLVQIRFSNQGSLLFEAPKPDFFLVSAIQPYS